MKTRIFLFLVVVLTITIQVVYSIEGGGGDCELITDEIQCNLVYPECRYLTYNSCCGKTKSFCVNNDQAGCSNNQHDLKCMQHIESGEIYEIWSSCSPSNGLVAFVKPNATSCDQLNCLQRGKECVWVEPPCHHTSCCRQYPICEGDDDPIFHISNNKLLIGDSSRLQLADKCNTKTEKKPANINAIKPPSTQALSTAASPRGVNNNNQKACPETKDACQQFWPQCKWMSYQSCCGKTYSTCMSDPNNQCTGASTLACLENEKDGEIYEIWSICQPTKGFKPFIKPNVTSCDQLNCEAADQMCMWKSTTKCLGTSCCQVHPVCVDIEEFISTSGGSSSELDSDSSSCEKSSTTGGASGTTTTGTTSGTTSGTTGGSEADSHSCPIDTTEESHLKPSTGGTTTDTPTTSGTSTTDTPTTTTTTTSSSSSSTTTTTTTSGTSTTDTPTSTSTTTTTTSTPTTTDAPTSSSSSSSTTTTTTSGTSTTDTPTTTTTSSTGAPATTTTTTTTTTAPVCVPPQPPPPSQGSAVAAGDSIKSVSSTKFINIPLSMYDDLVKQYRSTTTGGAGQEGLLKEIQGLQSKVTEQLQQSNLQSLSTPQQQNDQTQDNFELLMDQDDHIFSPKEAAEH
ncbi:hypothetical protein DFA_10066 [Cavenderia fasciculata]|uniref:DSCP-N domain-containing protein n=1 Tax=Cavenderia fasciculata TaxID=261658 RepID=F4Q965_CACFS|nr:uncharacterized protein DFA_10066 [Cavenderia fasciculata]EGG15234.1 hypothetical protein DFA_10066 [Cavenderia fasciculata]|eukprot:XP_004351954.1 hypothetical protein DFA_10066 [Cavenderia fasciculata]